MPKAEISIVSGAEGPSLYIGDDNGGHRLAGPKPRGGGHTTHSFNVDLDELIREAQALRNQDDDPEASHHELLEVRGPTDCVAIMELYEVAYSEGQVPDSFSPLLRWITSNYPDLFELEAFRHLPRQ